MHTTAPSFLLGAIDWTESPSQLPVSFYPQYQVASKMNSLGFPLMDSLVEGRDLLTSSYIYWRNKWMNELLKLAIYLTVNFLTSKIRGKTTSIPWIWFLSKLKKNKIQSSTIIKSQNRKSNNGKRSITSNVYFYNCGEFKIPKYNSVRKPYVPSLNSINYNLKHIWFLLIVWFEAHYFTMSFWRINSNSFLIWLFINIWCLIIE